MKTKSRFSLFAIMALLALLAAWPAAAQESAGPPHGGPHFGPPPGPPFWQDARLVKELGLTDKQVKELAALDESYRPEATTMHTTIGQTHRNFEKMLNSSSAGDEEIRDVARNLAELHSRMMDLDLEQRLKVRKVLTADQLTKLATMRRPDAPPPTTVDGGRLTVDGPVEPDNR